MEFCAEFKNDGKIRHIGLKIRGTLSIGLNNSGEENQTLIFLVFLYFFNIINVFNYDKIE